MSGQLFENSWGIDPIESGLLAIESFNKNDLIMSATAYYLGRRTISVDAHCEALVRAWPNLCESVRDYIKRIVEATFDQESNIQRIGRDWSPFGDACDRESWCKVRECWAGK
jgi:hypothetical protein